MDSDQETAFIQEILAQNLVSAEKIDEAYQKYEEARQQGKSVNLVQIFLHFRYLSPQMVQKVLQAVKEQPTIQPPLSIQTPPDFNLNEDPPNSEVVIAAPPNIPAPPGDIAPPSTEEPKIAAPPTNISGIETPKFDVPEIPNIGMPGIPDIDPLAPQESQLNIPSAEAPAPPAPTTNAPHQAVAARSVAPQAEPSTTAALAGFTRGSFFNRNSRLIYSVAALVVLSIGIGFLVTKLKESIDTNDIWNLAEKDDQLSKGTEGKGNDTEKKKEITIEEKFADIRNKFLARLDSGQYSEALEFLDKAPEDVKKHAGEEQLKSLRDLANEKSKKFLKQQSEVFQKHLDNLEFGPAKQILVQLKTSKLPDLQKTGSDLEVTYNDARQRADLIKRTEVFIELRDTIMPLVRKRSFEQAEHLLEKLLIEPENKGFLDVLEGYKEDAKHLHTLHSRLSDTLKEKINSFVMLNRRAGKLLDVNGDTISLQQGDGSMEMKMSQLPLKDIERILRLRGEKANANLVFALGMFAEFQGKIESAQGWFERVKDHPGIKRRQMLMKYESEAEALTLISDLRISAEREEMVRVKALATSLRSRFADTELVKVHQKWFGERVRDADEFLSDPGRRRKLALFWLKVVGKKVEQELNLAQKEQLAAIKEKRLELMTETNSWDLKEVGKSPKDNKPRYKIQLSEEKKTKDIKLETIEEYLKRKDIISSSIRKLKSERFRMIKEIKQIEIPHKKELARMREVHDHQQKSFGLRNEEVKTKIIAGEFPASREDVFEMLRVPVGVEVSRPRP